MKIIIFAGGVGTRLWPVSRKNTPKQFEKLIGDNSTLQETVARLQPDFPYSDIFIATGQRYEQLLKEQLPQIPSENFIFEPEMRDVGPAIGLVTHLLAKKFPDTPTAILWSDHVVKNIETFKDSLHMAESSILQNDSKFVFIAQKARFANQNMGWIELGEKINNGENIEVYKFKKLIYRPKLEEAKTFFKDKKYVWNLGYFVTTSSYLCSLYQKFTPEMSKTFEKISNLWGSLSYETALHQEYGLFEKISFDDLILMKMDDEAWVISADLGWSDVGAWESLKEALSETEDENVVRGNVLIESARDTLIFNYTDKLLVGIDLEKMLVINTGDVMLVCPKTSVPKIKKLVESLNGTAHEHLT